MINAIKRFFRYFARAWKACPHFRCNRKECEYYMQKDYCTNSDFNEFCSYYLENLCGACVKCGQCSFDNYVEVTPNEHK